MNVPVESIVCKCDEVNDLKTGRVSGLKWCLCEKEGTGRFKTERRQCEDEHEIRVIRHRPRYSSNHKNLEEAEQILS